MSTCISSSSQVLLEPLDTLLLAFIHSLLVLVRAPITSERKSVHLILVDADLALQVLTVLLLLPQVLNLLDLLLAQQTILVTQRKRNRHGQIVEIGGDRNQRRVTRIRRIHTFAIHARERLVRGQNRIPASPAEPNHAHFVRAGNVSDLVDEVLDQRSGHCLAVLEEPGAESCSGRRRGGCLLGQGAGFAFGELGLDGVEEGWVEGVALVDVWDVGCEAGGGVLVGEETGVCKFPAKDWVVLVG